MPRDMVRPKRNGTVKGQLLAAGIFVALVAGAFGLSLLRGNGSPQSPSSSTTTAPARDVGRFHGISLQLHSGHPDHPYKTYIDEIAATDANTVCLVVPGYQENASSTSIFIDARKAPRDERLVELMDHAHGLGLRVVLMPIVLLENPRSGEWRGKLDPNNWSHWWEDYNAFIIHYADVARKGRADALIIGSELVTTETQQKQWRYLIEQVRHRYDGLLSYSANWDHYEPVQWWDALDMLGITTYFDLTGGDEPKLERLMQSWQRVKGDILQWQSRQGKPILFTEVGWPNQETAAQYPWDYFRAEDRPDPKLQADCFEAFFRTWFEEPEVAGFLVWEWRNYPQQPIGPEDPSYVPVGKPALEVIRKYYSKPTSHHALPTTAPAAGSDEPTAAPDDSYFPSPPVSKDPDTLP